MTRYPSFPIPPVPQLTSFAAKPSPKLGVSPSLPDVSTDRSSVSSAPAAIRWDEDVFAGEGALEVAGVEQGEETRFKYLRRRATRRGDSTPSVAVGSHFNIQRLEAVCRQSSAR